MTDQIKLADVEHEGVKFWRIKWREEHKKVLQLKVVLFSWFVFYMIALALLGSVYS